MSDQIGRKGKAVSAMFINRGLLISNFFMYKLLNTIYLLLFWMFLHSSVFLPGTIHAVPALILGPCSIGHSAPAENTWERNPVWLQVPQLRGYIRHLRQSGQEHIHELLWSAPKSQHDITLKRERPEKLLLRLIHPSVHSPPLVPRLSAERWNG